MTNYLPTNPKTQMPAALLRKLPVLAMLAAGCCLALLGAGCGSPPTPQEAATPKVKPGPPQLRLTDLQAQNIGLQLGSPRRISLKECVSVNGEIQAINELQANVYTLAPGRVLSVPVQVGQQVRRGQLLASLKSDEIGQLQFDLLQQTLQNEADIRQANIEIEFSKAAYQRERQLFSEGVSAKADMESSRQQHRKNLASLKSLQIKQASMAHAVQERLSLYGVSPAETAQVLRSRRIEPYLSVVTPMDGIVTSRQVNRGELADTSKELFTIADLSRVKITGEVYEKDVAKIRLGQPVEFEMESGGTSNVYKGRLRFVSSVLDPQTRTLDVYGEIPNPNLVLKPNMFGRLSILVGERNVLAVPLSSVERIGDYEFVFVNAGPNVIEQRKVLTGKRNEQVVEIRGGLAGNERIAVKGTLGLKGMMIKLAGDTGGQTP